MKIQTFVFLKDIFIVIINYVIAEKKPNVVLTPQIIRQYALKMQPIVNVQMNTDFIMKIQKNVLLVIMSVLKIMNA